MHHRHVGSLDRQQISVWDADELEAALRDLVEAGEVQAGDVTEIIRHVTTVNGTEADRLVKRLTGLAKDAVERCRSWRAPGRSPSNKPSPSPTERTRHE